MIAPRHSVGRSRYRPMERLYIEICSCGTRLEGATQAEAEQRIAEHHTLNPIATSSEAAS